MTWTRFGRTLRTIGVVGSGQIGPDIALYFAKTLSPVGVRTVVHDIAPAALEAGRAKLAKKIDRGVESRAFSPDQAKSMLGSVEFTDDPTQLAGADLVVEAATENPEIKRKIFADLAAFCAPDAILASNSSHLEPEVLFDGIRNPGRALVTHYFYPAERNPVVEVVPGRATDPAVADYCMKFFEAIGKIPIRVGSRYGYAIDPVFEGLFLAALLLADSGIATPPQIDFVAQQSLGLGVGPFTAMNLTGGTPLTRTGIGQYHDRIMPWFRVPKSLETRSDPWPSAGKDEKIVVTEAVAEKVSRRLRGAYFGLIGDVLDGGITNVSDLEMGVETALVMKPPFQMMNEVGVGTALSLVEEYASENPGFRVARCLRRSEPWTVPFVLRRDVGDVAIVTVRRPRTLNALNREIYRQIRETFLAIRKDAKVRAVVLTGFGPKAFVSGADIGMLAAVRSAEEGAALSWESQEVLLAIENLGKPVVCAMNGMALGGGSELAMACTVRIAPTGLPVCFGQPEPKLGIIPGAGATQRLPRIVGFKHAWEILRTGRPVSGQEAERIGYLTEQVSGELLDRAVELARALPPGHRIRSEPLERTANLADIDIGPLSRKVDEILRHAILRGCAQSLEEGLRFESECFGEVCATRDMRIGIENFLETQLKRPAAFVHA